MKTIELKEKIQQLPLGYTKAIYQGKSYGVTRVDFNKGKSIKVYAEELGGNDFISLNYYSTKTADIVKPCEMQMEKIIHFLMNLKLQNG